MFYKNMSCYTPFIWFGMFNGFSGLEVYDEFLGYFFNIMYTNLPIVFYALCDEMYNSGPL